MAEKKSEPVCPLCGLLSALAETDVVKHLRKARKEMLLAARCIIDRKLARLEEKEEPE